jgi:hypothetical protein
METNQPLTDAAVDQILAETSKMQAYQIVIKNRYTKKLRIPAITLFCSRFA